RAPARRPITSTLVGSAANAGPGPQQTPVLRALESEARTHSLPQSATRRQNKAISSQSSLRSPMYAARAMAIKKVPIPVCLAHRLVVSHYHTRSSLIDQLVSPPIVTRDET